MATSILPTLSLFWYTALLAIPLIPIPSLVISITFDGDIRVLRHIKEAVDPVSVTPTSFMRTWNFPSDPCESVGPNFLGILCTIPEDNSSSRVTVINLDGDGLEGFLPSTIGNLSELTVLNLRKNKFRGPIPSSIAKLSKLTTLLMSENFFSGGIPEGMNRLKRLETIDLSKNRLSGSIPAKITALRSLTHLNLSSNQLTGKIPDLSGLWQLDKLDISSNEIYGSLPQLPSSLRTLLLAHNLISGHVTSSIKKLRHLRNLDLSDNRLSGYIDQNLLTLPDVYTINVSSNLFTTINVIDVKHHPSQLQRLDATGNRLRGHLPLHLTSYQNLRAIYLGHNLLSGKIPNEYGAKLGRSWRVLFLDYNFLEGFLPQEFNNGSRMLTGSLAHNCLHCPLKTPVCHGGQRAPTECIGLDSGGGHR